MRDCMDLNNGSASNAQAQYIPSHPGPAGATPNSYHLRTIIIVIFAAVFLGAIGFFIFQIATAGNSGNVGNAPTIAGYEQGRVGIDAGAYATLAGCKPELRVYGADKAELDKIVANLSAANALAGINASAAPVILRFKDRQSLVNAAFDLKWRAAANITVPCTVTINSKKLGIMVRWEAGAVTFYDKPWVLQSEVSPFLPVGTPFNATCQAGFTQYSKLVRRPGGKWTTNVTTNLTSITDLQAPGRRYNGYKATGTVAPSPWPSIIVATIPNTAEIDGLPYLLVWGAYPASGSLNALNQGSLVVRVPSNISLETANSTPMDVYMDLELDDGFAMANNFRLEK